MINIIRELRGDTKSPIVEFAERTASSRDRSPMKTFDNNYLFSRPVSFFYQAAQGILREWIAKNPFLHPLIRTYRRRALERIPSEVNVETTSVCNARCTMCPIDKITRPKRPMDFGLFEKIVKDCIGSGVRSIKLHNYGEPLLTPRFDKMLHFIRKNSRDIDIQFATNGALLDERWANVLILQRVNKVLITIDGFKKETYEEVRKGLSYDKVVKNVKKLKDIKKRHEAKYPEIVVEIIEMEQTRDEIGDFVKYWENFADQVIVARYSSRAGELGEVGSSRSEGPCFRLWKQLVVTNTGEVALCCTDWNCSMVLGDMRTQTLREIWQGPLLKELRRKHLDGKAAEIPICSRCSPESWDSMPTWWFH